MAVTAVYHPFGETDFTLSTLKQKRIKIVFGTMDYGATAGGGATWTLPMGVVLAAVIEPANGYVYRYDIDNTLVKAYQCGAPGSVTTAVAMSQVATGTSTATCTALHFMAWGYE